MKNSGGNAKGSHSGEAWTREIQHVTEGQMRRGGKGAMGERCRAAHSGGALGQTRGRRGGPWQHSGLCLHLRGRAEEAGQGRWRRQLGRAAGSNIRWRGEQTVPFVQCPCACPLTPLLIMLLIITWLHAAACWGRVWGSVSPLRIVSPCQRSGVSPRQCLLFAWQAVTRWVSAGPSQSTPHGPE